MEKSKVAIIRCDEYNDELVFNSVRKGIDLLGGITNFAKSGEKMVLKPNVLIGSSPDRSVTTHPTVFKAVGKLLQVAEAKVYYGDSSAFGSCEFNMKRANLKQAGDELGFNIADFDHGREVYHKSALLNKKFIIANGVLNSDGVISLPKMKTHQLTRFTGAVKNQFGCVPGLHKREFHFKMPDPFDFSIMLVDLNTFIRPRLFVMDGVIAMEGNGPFSGSPRKMNVLLFSADPIAMDAIACKMIDLNPEFVPTSKPGEKSGLGTYHYENIDLVGDELESFIVKDFKVVRKPPVHATSGGIKTFIKNQLTPKPVINKTKCSGCGTCIKVCPVGTKALTRITDKKNASPKHNYSHCIRCYCCQETCPQGAITVKSPFLGKLIFRR
jgi:uncharacterized protein (DUF362 family)/Pyruvate/2-oxoacid:ferredoxin oxidoreductase delta subunit